jgi:hypothetical protein
LAETSGGDLDPCSVALPGAFGCYSITAESIVLGCATLLVQLHLNRVQGCLWLMASPLVELVRDKW